MLSLTKFNAVLEFLVIPTFISLSVIFKGEFKRIVTFFRESSSFDSSSSFVDAIPSQIKTILTAVDSLCKNKLGALIVIEMKQPLMDFIETGIQIHGEVSSDLLTSLFIKDAPTHDGAVIIRNNRIVAAGCFLPLTDSTKLDSRMGTRHLAAIGLSERSDAFIIVVSEETGTISIVEKGHITRYLNRSSLETRLFDLYNEQRYGVI